jgi:HPt (histidine-containing phosphotransfer) domain-containing protein
MSGEHALLDRTQLEQIRQLESFRPGTAARLLALFEANVAERLDALRRAADAGDVDGVRGAAHSLKGVAASLGASELSRLAACIEADASYGSVPAAALVSTLDGTIGATLRSLSTWLTEASA